MEIRNVYVPYDVRILAESQAVQKLYKFDNGFGASVVRGQHTYGGDEMFWELAVIKFEEGENANDFHLVYPKNVCAEGDVIGWLNDEDIEKNLLLISQLTGNEEMGSISNG